MRKEKHSVLTLLDMTRLELAMHLASLSLHSFFSPALLSYNGYWHAHDISLTHGETVTQIIDLIMAEKL